MLVLIMSIGCDAAIVVVDGVSIAAAHIVDVDDIEVSQLRGCCCCSGGDVDSDDDVVCCRRCCCN